jgi:hypothetical protein
MGNFLTTDNVGLYYVFKRYLVSGLVSGVVSGT